MAELGAGWAPWLVRAALAPASGPGSSGSSSWRRADPCTTLDGQHFEDNGLDPRLTTSPRGGGGPRGRPAVSRVDEPDVTYGASLAAAALGAADIEVTAYTIPRLLDFFSGPVDFLHIDIQGAEYEAVPQAMADLTARVRSMMIGTHRSDALHDGLVEALRAAGWRETMNLARKRTHALPWGEIAVDDGFLLFENPGLA
jgi:hypothetical protein